MQHVDETDGGSKAERYLVVVINDSCKLILAQELAHHLQMHLALLHLDLERTRRIHRPVLVIMHYVWLLRLTFFKLLELLLF